MRRVSLLLAFSIGLTISQPAVACRIRMPMDLANIQYADVVVVGRISNYRIIRDEAWREQRRAIPNLSADDLAQLDGPLLTDYARFEIEVDEVLLGDAPARVPVTWDNSTFGEPEALPTGPYLIALRSPSSPAPPLRGPSATFFPNAEPNLFTLLQAPCSSAFLFEEASDQAGIIRQLLRAEP